MFFLGISILGLMMRPDNSPKSIDDIPDSYALLFMAPEHFEVATEALQSRLDMNHYAKSTFLYFRSLANTFLHIDQVNEGYLFPNSVERLKKEISTDSFRIQDLKCRQSRLDDDTLGNNGAIAAIPSVLGESPTQRVLKANRGLRTAHAAMKKNLLLRRQITASFPEDPPYDYRDYHNPKISSVAKDALNKIRVWTPNTAEELIYLQGKELATLARADQERRNGGTRISPKSYQSVTIASLTPSISFLPQIDYTLLDRKIKEIQAMRFEDLNKKIREPLIGEIEPSLVEKIIKRNNFEIQLCFETALRRDRELRGTMEWEWTIDTRGTIEDIELLSSTIKDELMIGCIRKKIAGWKFPRPKKGSVAIRYPFEFKPARG